MMRNGRSGLPHRAASRRNSVLATLVVFLDHQIPALAILQRQRLNVTRLAVDLLQLGHPGQLADNAIALAHSLVLERIELGDLLGKFSKRGHRSVLQVTACRSFVQGLYYDSATARFVPPVGATYAEMIPYAVKNCEKPYQQTPIPSCNSASPPFCQPHQANASSTANSAAPPNQAQP